jgi:TolB protein
MKKAISIAAALFLVAVLAYVPRALAKNPYSTTIYLRGAGHTANGVNQNPEDIYYPAVGGPPHSIAFQSDRDGNSEIYVMSPDGSDQIRLTFDSRNDQRPDISPDGRFVVFSSNRITENNPEGDFEIFVMNSDGSDVRQLTTNVGFVDSWPRWSPNGKWIAFHSNVDGNFEIYLIRPDGTDLTRVTDYPSLDQFPEWSPDGKQLVIRRDVDIYVIDVDGSNPIQLTGQAGLNQMASWSPDGKQLAFMSTREGYPSVFVMDADGSNQVNLTPKPADVPASMWSSRAPGWWRNGQYIYFTSRRPGTNEHENIFVMNADGTDVMNLTDVPGNSAEGAVR